MTVGKLAHYGKTEELAEKNRKWIFHGRFTKTIF